MSRTVVMKEQWFARLKNRKWEIGGIFLCCGISYKSNEGTVIEYIICWPVLTSRLLKIKRGCKERQPRKNSWSKSCLLLRVLPYTKVTGAIARDLFFVTEVYKFMVEFIQFLKNWMPKIFVKWIRNWNERCWWWMGASQLQR